MLSYGTNGFYLNFSDNSTTATTLGKDSSGNGNNYTKNFSVVLVDDSLDTQLIIFVLSTLMIQGVIYFLKEI